MITITMATALSHITALLSQIMISCKVSTTSRTNILRMQTFIGTDIMIIISEEQ